MSPILARLIFPAAVIFAVMLLMGASPEPAASAVATASPTPDSWRAVVVGRLKKDGGTIQMVAHRALDPVPTINGDPTPLPTMWGRLRYSNRMNTVVLTSYGFDRPGPTGTHDLDGCGVLVQMGQRCGFDGLTIEGLTARATIDASGDNPATLVDRIGPRMVGVLAVITAPAQRNAAGFAGHVRLEAPVGTLLVDDDVLFGRAQVRAWTAHRLPARLTPTPTWVPTWVPSPTGTPPPAAARSMRRR